MGNTVRDIESICLIFFPLIGSSEKAEAHIFADTAIKFYLIKVHKNFTHLTNTHHDNDRNYCEQTRQCVAFSFASDQIIWKNAGIKEAVKRREWAKNKTVFCVMPVSVIYVGGCDIEILCSSITFEWFCFWCLFFFCLFRFVEPNEWESIDVFDMPVWIKLNHYHSHVCTRLVFHFRFAKCVNKKTKTNQFNRTFPIFNIIFANDTIQSLSTISPFCEPNWRYQTTPNYLCTCIHWIPSEWKQIFT